MADEKVVDVVKANGKGNEGKSWRDELVIDISGLTRRDLIPFFENMDGKKKLLKRVVKQMPKEWGDDVAAKDFKTRHFVTVIEEFGNILQANKPLSVDVTFDVWEMPMSDYEAISTESTPRLLATYVRSAPKSWGPVDDVNTWLDLPQPIFLAVQDAFKEALACLNLG